MDSSVTELLLQVHRRRLRTVLHGLKFLQSFGTKLDVWSFFPPAKPADGRRRRPTHERQRSLLDCIDSEDDEYSYEDALSSFSPAPSSAAIPDSGATGVELASDECFDRFIINFHRRLVNEKKVSIELPKCRCFAAMDLPGSTPTPSTTLPCRTPISPDSYFNLEKQKAAGYICS